MHLCISGEYVKKSGKQAISRWKRSNRMSEQSRDIVFPSTLVRVVDYLVSRSLKIIFIIGKDGADKVIADHVVDSVGTQ